MARCSFTAFLCILGAAWAADPGASAQPLPAPPLQACSSGGGVSGKTGGVWESRRDAQHSGRFVVTFDLDCTDGIPAVRIANLEIRAQELADNDPGIGPIIWGESVEQLVSIGPAMTPTVFVVGSCKGGGSTGCRFWMMLVDNGPDQAKAPDLIAFVVTDGSGKRLAYGAGPIGEGDLRITETR